MRFQACFTEDLGESITNEDELNSQLRSAREKWLILVNQETILAVLVLSTDTHS